MSEDKNLYKSSHVIFANERMRINRIIDKLNNNGEYIPRLKSFKTFYVNCLLEKKIFEKKLTYKEIKNKNECKNNCKEKDCKNILCEKKYYDTYIKYVDGFALSFINDYENRTEEIEEINASIQLDQYKFRSSGFFQFIKHEIWNIDLTKKEDFLLDSLILEWYDLTEKERRSFRKLGAKRLKFRNIKSSMRKDKHVIDNFMDIDIGWDSNEEWVE